MRGWFEGLAPRERMLVVIGAIAFAVILLWTQLWLPLSRGVESQRETLTEQQSLLAWIETQAPRLERLRAAGVDTDASAAIGQGQLLVLADRGAKTLGLGEAIQRSNPETGGGVRVVLEDAEFDLVMRWLAQLAREHGIQAANMVTTAKDKPGFVDTRVTLIAPGGGDA